MEDKEKEIRQEMAAELEKSHQAHRASLSLWETTMETNKEGVKKLTAHIAHMAERTLDVTDVVLCAGQTSVDALFRELREDAPSYGYSACGEMSELEHSPQ